MTNCIEVAGLTKSYKDFSLQNISFQLPYGSIMGLIGENGAGKTTLIKCLLNLTHRDAGKITLLGRDNISEEQAIKEEVGVVLDDCFFHDTLRPKDLNTIFSSIYPKWDRVEYQNYLDKFHLPSKKFVKEFSRGMKMKLSLSVALAHHSKLLILDEATSGLDPIVRDEILDEFLAFISDESHSILLSSHITSDLEKISDYITYVHQGQIRLSQSKDEILERYGRVGCTSEELRTIDRHDLLYVRQGSFGCDALVSDRSAFHQKYPNIMVESTSLEDIMLFVGRGESI